MVICMKKWKRPENKALRLLLYHGLAVLALLFLMFVYKCPLNYFFHIPCPGCGISRAYLAAARLDFKAAFTYHPLFFLAAPTVLYAAHRSVLKKRLRGKTEAVLFGVMLALFVAVYVYRLLSGTAVA